MHSNNSKQGPDPIYHQTLPRIIDPHILATKRGMLAVIWSFVGLIMITFAQALVVYFSQSVALLGDTIHNLGDAFTAIPLGFAFIFGQRQPTKRFTYGYGRLEDLAGIFVILTVLGSAIFAGYASIERFFNPQQIEYIWAVGIAAIIGFLGNESVAILRIKIGQEIGSAALVADGHHARIDGLVSLGVLVSVVGEQLGYPLADPIMGIVITLMIMKIVWETSVSVLTRLLDGIDPHIVDQIHEVACCIREVKEVNDVRARWIGHRLHAEINITVDQNMSVEEGHEIANQVRYALFDRLRFLSYVTIHVDPPHISKKE